MTDANDAAIVGHAAVVAVIEEWQRATGCQSPDAARNSIESLVQQLELTELQNSRLLKRVQALEQQGARMSDAASLHGIVSTPLKVAEGISSTWHYHLRREDQRVCESLCGAQVFTTEIPLKTWGMVTHLRERYCKECEDIARRSC